MNLDKQAILDLCRLRDPVGVISIYAGTTPDRQVHERPDWAVSIRNALKQLRQQVKDDGPRERWNAVSARLDDLEGDIEWLCDPRERGRGRALFAPVSDGSVERLTIQLPLEDEVVLEESAYVRPLVAVLDEGRPAGIANVDRSGVRLLDWRLGEVEELGFYEFTDRSDEWRELKGPAAANPALGQQTAPQRQLFEERLDEHRQKFLRTVAGEMEPHVKQRGWDRMVVAGDGRLVQPFMEGLDAQRNHLDVIHTEHELRQVPIPDVADIVGSLLEGFQRDRERSLVDQAVERALGGGQGAVGPADVLDALNDGRIQTLLYRADLDLSGQRAEDGRLLPQEATGEDLAPEPLLVERMIERALETSAEVIPVEGGAAGALSAHGGVAAILRW